jgi:hypothetical protein
MVWVGACFAMGRWNYAVTRRVGDGIAQGELAGARLSEMEEVRRGVLRMGLDNVVVTLGATRRRAPTKGCGRQHPSG